MNDSNDSWSLNNLRKEESLWEEAQKKTFCGWLNMHLGKRDLRVQDLSTDLSDGVKLIALLEILNNSKIEGRYYRNPKSKPYKIDNVNFALNFITDTLKIKLISCSAEDVVDGNVKIILGMLWRLIQKFQLTTDNSRAELLNWCKKITASYNGVSVENFQSSFENGLAFCALVHHYNPSLLDFNSLKPENKLQNLQLAFNVAEEHLEIPALLDAKDISNGLVDERSVMTYISMIQQNSSKPPASSTTATTPKSENASLSQKETPKSPEVDHTASLTIASIESEVAALKQTILKLEADLGVSSHRERDLTAQLEATKAELKAALQKQSELQAEIDLLREQAATAAASTTTPPASTSTTANEGDESKREAVKEEEVADKPVVEEHVVPVQVRDSPREPVEPVKQPEPEPVAAAVTEPVKQVEKSEEKSVSETKKEESSPAADTDKKEAPSADLQNEILETRDKLRQQVKVSETLQKSLEDTREEIVLIQKGQKRAQDKALKKQQKRYEKRIQRRDKEIESLKKNYEAEMQQKNNELQNLQNQLKKAQKALGGAVEPETSALDADIEYLKQQKEELLIIVQNFEEEERALAKKSARRIEEEDDKEGSESERV